MKKAKFFANIAESTFGIIRIVFYRTFIYRDWRSQHPMFNLVEVEKGKESLYLSFLERAEKKSVKYKTPVSFGPYQVIDQPVFFSITHHYSTLAFIKVMTAILLSGLGFTRARCSTNSNWSFCDPNMSTSPVIQPEKVIIVGIEGASRGFENYLSQKGVNYHGKIQRIKTVRSTSLDDYIVFEDTIENNTIIEAYQKGAVSIKVYKANLIFKYKEKVDVPALSK